MIFCLGIYFLSLFFQVARLEKLVTEGVMLLEQFMIVKYSLGVDKKKTSAVPSDAPPPAGEKDGSKA